MARGGWAPDPAAFVFARSLRPLGSNHRIVPRARSPDHPPPIPSLLGSRALWYGALPGQGDGERGTALKSDDRRWLALARPALVVFALCLLVAASAGGNHAGRSLAQEGAATPA